MTDHRFRYDFDVDEYVRVSMICTSDSPAARRYRLRLGLIPPMLSLLGFALWSFTPKSHPSRGAIFGLSSFVLLWFPLFAFFALPRIWRRNFRTGATSDSRVLCQHELALTDAGVEHTAAGSTLKTAWPAVLRYRETPEFILFYMTPDTAYYLPRRVLQPSDLDTIRDFVNAATASRLSNTTPLTPRL